MPYAITCMWNLKYDTNEFFNKTETDSQTKKINLVEKEMATRSNILAWKSPWTKEPGGLQSMGLHV